MQPNSTGSLELNLLALTSRLFSSARTASAASAAVASSPQPGTSLRVAQIINRRDTLGYLLKGKYTASRNRAIIYTGSTSSVCANCIWRNAQLGYYEVDTISSKQSRWERMGYANRPRPSNPVPQLCTASCIESDLIQTCQAWTA